MMSGSWEPATKHRRKVELWWIGRTVRITRDIVTPYREYKSGEIFRVNGKFRGHGGGLEGHALNGDGYVRNIPYRLCEIDIEKEQT